MLLQQGDLRQHILAFGTLCLQGILIFATGLQYLVTLYDGGARLDSITYQRLVDLADKRAGDQDFVELDA